MKMRALCGLLMVACGGLWLGAEAAPKHEIPKGLAPEVAPAVEGDGYKLVWADEFNTDGPPDPKTWKFEQGLVRNEELQWYQPENAVCKGGMLVIEGRRESKPNPNYDAEGKDWRTKRKTIEYTASSMTTNGTHDWLYGRFEMRAKIDVRKGSWPAFWTLGHGRWPGCGEVDIMEYYNDTILGNIGWAGEEGIRWNSRRVPLAEAPADWATKFHVWRMDWDEKVMALYLDGQLFNAQDLSKTINAGRGRMAGQNPFHGPMYLLINQAIGGQGQDPSGTAFPVRYEVDYVRVYQKAGMDGRGAETRPAR